jgi:RNA-directed DNA polymerase
MEEGVFQPTRLGTPQGGVISPLLANIALNSLDWRLHERGYRFVRYADDFVVLCQTAAQVQEAHALVQQHLTSLGLSLSAEKTKTTQFREGFAFLGFVITSWSIAMRPKSVEKFKTKVRELTPRSHNLDARVIEKLNRVIRGTANYFATTFSDVGDCFRGLDRWIRMRLRCMKYKRKSRADNGRIRLERFRRLGLLFLSDLRPAPA